MRVRHVVCGSMHPHVCWVHHSLSCRAASWLSQVGGWVWVGGWVGGWVGRWAGGLAGGRVGWPVGGWVGHTGAAGVACRAWPLQVGRGDYRAASRFSQVGGC
jgi:hypothetical protein